jgi:lipoate-protein ligase A
MSYELKWRLIDSGRCDAAYNMALDEAIAISVRNGKSPPILRIYGWECPSVSLGSFQNIDDIDIKYCSENKIAVVRRPTGGRGILHGDELTYSFCALNEGEFSGGLLETYRKLSSAFQTALEAAGLKVSIKTRRESGRNLARSPLCFKSTSFGELSFNGKKLIGSAQKRWHDGFLQQGSIPYSVDYEKLIAVFKQYSITSEPPSFRTNHEIIGLRKLIAKFDPKSFKEAIRLSFERVFNITLADSLPFRQEYETALVLMKEKYLNPLWTRGEKNILNCNKTGIPKPAI